MERLLKKEANRQEKLDDLTIKFFLLHNVFCEMPQYPMIRMIRFRRITSFTIGLLFIFCIAQYPQNGHTGAFKNETCMECHADKQLMGEVNGQSVSMFIDYHSFKTSAHKGFDCIACHTDIVTSPHPIELEKVECNHCHNTYNEIANTVHATEKGPSCIACHGDAHQLLSAKDQNSFTNQFKIGMQCAQCHKSTSLIKNDNIHAIALASGNSQAPSCVHCHDYHSIMPLRNPQSKTNFFNIADTCGECHPAEMQQYKMSIHGKSALTGHKNAPVCTDCHGEHAIYKVEDERSPASFFKVSENSCGRCHGSLLMTNEHNKSNYKVETFFDSYHGLALQNGSKEVANCSSCHGAHFILPSADPNSSVHPDNLAATCAQCHAELADGILAAPVHTGLSNSSYTSTSWMHRIFISMITLIIGATLLYYLIPRNKWRRNKIKD